MKRFHLVVGLLALVAIAASTALGAASSAVNHDFTEGTAVQAADSGYAIVVLKDPPAASYTGGVNGLKATKPAKGQNLDPNGKAVRAYVDHLRSAHSEYRSWMSSGAKDASVVREYFLAGNAIAVKLNGTKPENLSNGPGVSKVTGSWLYKPAMTVSTGLIDADELWALNGGRSNAGSGVKVGIIDSGIDESHPAFACKGDIQNKVYASGGDPAPFNLPTLVNDHGTHVAGTVAGCEMSPKAPVSGTFSGVAPGAQLYDYNVFPGFGAGFIAFGGSAFSHDICAAIEDAVADGMDVINMSLGGSVQGPHDFLAECTDAAVDAGVVAAVAASNDGPGDMTVGSPGSAPKALTVGASTNPHFVGIPVTKGGTTYGAALGDFAAYEGTTTADYTITVPANGCTAITNDVSGKIALIDRGACTFGTKVRAAEAAGAAGVLVVNNVAGDPSAMGTDGLGNGTIPAAMLGKNDGNALKPSGTVTIDGSNPQEFLTENEDIIAGFSSRGPTPFTYLAKPEVTAPGVNIYSSVFEQDFAFFQGTSMATPHVAGSAALLLALHPSWSPDDVKSALANTAARVVTDHVNGTTDPGVLARGGGRIDLDAANASPVALSPALVSFGLVNGNKSADVTRTVSVSSLGGSASSCSVSVEGGSGLVSAGSATVSVPGTLSLTLSGGRTATTSSGDKSGDVVLSCGGTTLKAPWWVRIDRQGKP